MSGGKAALDYRRRGFSVIPVRPKDKKPLIGWEPYQKEPASEATIKHWFDSWPNANLAIVTGAVSDCVVIDLDSKEAKDTLKSMVSDYDLAAVPRVRTGRGGYHLFFKHPGVPVQTRAGILPKTDVRADGGYVVTAPSIHESGKSYAWEVPVSGELPALPDELFKLVSSPPNNGHSNGNGNYHDRFDTAQALKGVPEGQRDETIFKLACKLRHADVPRAMGEQLILEAAKNCDPPFSERTALDKVERAYSRYLPGNGKANGHAYDHIEMPAPVVVEPEPEEELRAFPETAWDGHFAKWRDVVAPCTEAPLENLWAAFLLAAGMILGRNVWRETPRPLYLNFYLLLIGQTGDSRKSTVLWLACELLRRIGEDFKELFGVVSSEGIYESLAQREETKALIYADEFRALLSVGKRKGTADILPKLNTLYYCPERDSIDRVKDSTIIVRPFLSMVTATPQAYVDDLLGDSEIAGGFLNRFIVVSGEEQAPRPIVRQPSKDAWESIAGPLRAIRERAEDNPRHMELQPEAEEVWKQFYTAWRNERKGWHPKQAQLPARTFEHVLKASMVYSVLAGREQIDVDSLCRAIDVGGWIQSNTLRLFSDTGLDQLGKVERAITSILKPKKRMYRRDLQQAISKKGFNAELFNRALMSLEKNDVVALGRVVSPAGRDRPTVDFLDGNTGTGNR